MLERTSDINEEACTCFINWHKVFDHANSAKLLHNPKEHKYRLERKNIDQNIAVHGSKRRSTTAPWRNKKCEDLNRS